MYLDHLFANPQRVATGDWFASTILAALVEALLPPSNRAEVRLGSLLAIVPRGVLTAELTVPCVASVRVDVGTPTFFPARDD